MTAITDGNENESLSSLAQETVTIDGEPTVIIDTSDSSSPVVETDQVYDAVSSIKEEDVCINAVEFNDSPPVGFPKAVVGLHEMGPTSFLKKTFEMVDDAVTNPVVSWSPTRESFIIWDSYKFSETLLPRYFKHRNFSSFVRQLNTYGFRKVDTDRWEFANKEFQGGNKHLLKNIKRRCKIKSKKDTSVDTEVESLKKDQSSMRLEILKLKQQQEEYHHQMVTVQEKIHVVESKQQHMLSFFTKLAKEQRFVERLMRKMRKSNPQRDLEATEFVKQLKLLQDQETLVSDMIIREGLTMAATQSNPESDIVMNDESGYTTCQLNTEELLVEGLIGEDSSFVDVNENSGGEEWSDTKTILSPVLRN